MDSKKVGSLMLLGMVMFAYYSTMPNDPVLREQQPAEGRHDLDTGKPDASGGDYQPASLSGSGQPPRYMTYMYQ
jgi:hypothetical protein